jgi:hypothetical protein
MNKTPLYVQRGQAGFNTPLGQSLAPQEHRQFARDWVSINPYLALPSLMFAIPGYYAYKSMGLKKNATPPSFDQLAGGYSGMWEGLSDYMKR